MKKQAFNPFLPLSEYVPDGEPHVFDGRVYIYGSHDREGGYTFCMDDYVTYSAPVDDLSDWRYEGVIYKAEQDPDYDKLPYMYAPDVVKGNDGRYYLYYCLSGEYGYGGYTWHISVAVADGPAGPYEYLGFVKNPDGTPMKRYICFDPAVLNDDGVIRLYYGTQYPFEEEARLSGDPEKLEEVLKNEMDMFGKTKEELLSYPDSVNGPIMCVLDDDMLTVKEAPRHIIPYETKGTDFEEHPFFEASSMRKVNGKYYFVYSSWQNHELCYATSDYPDRDFVFGGTIISNGDIGYQGRSGKDKMNMTGTTHGSIELVGDQWYVFFHRLTHKSDYSRQACAEKITIEADGSIKQVELTSCGMNDGPLKGEGTYPAVICCNLTNGHMPHGCNSMYTISFPNVNNKGDDRFIAEIGDGTLIGYKYFDLAPGKTLSLVAREENDETKVIYDGPVRVDERVQLEMAGYSEEKLSQGSGAAGADAAAAQSAGTAADGNYFELRTVLGGEVIARIDVDGADSNWQTFAADAPIPEGKQAIFLTYHGEKKMQLKELVF